MPKLNQVRPFPKPGDWQELERITADLFKEIWQDPYATLFGRQGHKQYGVDILGTPDGGKNHEGVQCKSVETIVEKEVRDEYFDSNNFEPRLSCFIIATTAHRDPKIQQVAVQLSQTGPYRCVVFFWQDICDMLTKYPSVLRKYYADFFIFETIGDSPGKLIRVDIDTNHYELLISKMSVADSHYSGVLLVADLLNRKCQTYRMGDHWSRLDGIIGYGAFDAFLVSSFLNSIGDIDKLLNKGQDYLIFAPTSQQVKGFRDEIKDS